VLNWGLGIWAEISNNPSKKMYVYISNKEAYTQVNFVFVSISLQFAQMQNANHVNALEVCS
jgi:hypothetical protein